MKIRPNLGNGGIYCSICDVYYPKRIWRNGKHKGTARCKKAMAERPMREKAMAGALSNVNNFFGGK